MSPFLKLIAHSIHAQYGNDLSRIAIIFPNKRAALFFNEYLADESDQPLWSPAYLSISELLQSLSTLRPADPLQLIAELYPIFTQETQSQESFDDFYFWGEVLISDFDDVDKHLVEADKLFRNLSNLKSIMDDLDFLDKEQEEAIRQFFTNFSIERHTQLKQKFTSIWDALGNIYNAFRQRLAEQHIAYEGMLYRDAILQLDTDKLPYDNYIFVGFNLLNQVENRLFASLQQAGKATFYWDYDRFYVDTPTHEAGTFIRKNLEQFPSPPLHAGVFDNLSAPKTVNYISASTENAQARYLPEWIRTTLTGEEKENAVVLCNESLLLPVLHSIPREVQHINITMGFPLAQTPAYTFINALLELQTAGYNPGTGRYTHASVQNLLKHPYTRSLSAHAETLERELTSKNRFYPYPAELQRDTFLHALFTPVQGNAAGICRYIIQQLQEATTLYRPTGDDEDPFGQLYRESLFKSFTIVNRMHSLLESGTLTLKPETLRQLIQKTLADTHIPFHGEPAVGMQVMGVLETRNLDFKNLIILSLNEGLLPKAGEQPSFIPYNLRKAFGMTTREQRDALYAYYFYRLIQRAEQITLVHNTSSDGLNRGEASRFLLQFLIEWPHPVKHYFLEAGQSPQTHEPITIAKTPDVLDRLYKLYSREHGATAHISPSALNIYLDCRLKFYFRYIAGLKAPDEINTQIDSATFGRIFHRAVELVYLKLTETGKQIRKEDLEELLKSETRVQEFVNAAFKEIFFHVAAEERPEYNGTQLINSKVITTYVRQLLRNDLQYAPFEMIGMEQKVQEEITIRTPQGDIQACIGGTIDRLDSKDGTLRVVDYKTGGTPKTPTGVEQLFTRSGNRPGYIFQTFLYAAIIARQQPLKVAPALLYIHRAASESYSPVIEMGEPYKPKFPVNNFAFYEDDFRQRLQELLEEIYHPDISFDQTQETQLCEYCDFRSLC